VVSYRAKIKPTERRLALPAAIMSRLWAVGDRPRIDRWIADADVVHGTNYTAPPSRLPTVISVYDCWFLEHPDQASPAVRRAGQILRRAVARRAWIHVSSQATAERAAALLDTDRIEVIHLGPPHPAAPSAPSAERHQRPNAPYLLSIGTIERRKGIPQLIDAFHHLGRSLGDQQVPDLVIAGAPGDDQSVVEARLDALDPSLRQRVHVLGSISAEHKAELLAHAELLVYPSLDEGFGFPILEAQQARCPVVATAVGSIPEIGGSGVELCVSGDAEALAAAIVQVLDDRQRRSHLIEHGTANLQRFSWERTVDAFINLYRRVAETG
jgi:glycosyltransferase involved in cell wall biosynthesis